MCRDSCGISRYTFSCFQIVLGIFVWLFFNQVCLLRRSRNALVILMLMKRIKFSKLSKLFRFVVSSNSPSYLLYLSWHFEAQLGQEKGGVVTIFPTLIINNSQYRGKALPSHGSPQNLKTKSAWCLGKLERTSVLKAICSGYKEGTEPLICLSTGQVTSLE